MNVYCTKEASAKMGISERHLRLLLESGMVKGKKLSREWVVLSLEYKRKRKPKKPSKIPLTKMIDRRHS